MAKSRAAPLTKPRSGGSHGSIPISSASVIAGAKSDQKLAAIITPAAKPSEASRNLRLTVLVRNTTAAPSAVTPHVKSVATSACITGCMSAISAVTRPWYNLL